MEESTDGGPQLYHSIHARGERIEDVLKSAEMAEAESSGTDPSTSAPLPQAMSSNAEDLEEGELEENGDEQSTDKITSINQPVGIVRCALRHQITADLCLRRQKSIYRNTQLHSKNQFETWAIRPCLLLF